MSDKKRLEERFDTADINHDGKLPADKVFQFMENFGFKKWQIRKFVEPFDKNTDGCITKCEFKHGVENLEGSLITEARMRKQFREEDQNKTGKITTKSLKEQLQNKKAKINMDDVEKWIKENDKDKDGKVDFEEFFKFARHKL
ncbi:hypothetical protein P879_07066 [Paragonimus westermani]|uniref:EF-hand domain-containing protein n=1 Tax=Paragonimus westermani TaxID=34504 RepID=A0A8T0D466_9TREM|nr:hypothetical protein P879_07066 [Paragonimus westermani]